MRDHQVSIQLIGTKEMIADPLTKGLPVAPFQEHVVSMGVIDLTDIFS